MEKFLVSTAFFLCGISVDARNEPCLSDNIGSVNYKSECFLLHPKMKELSPWLLNVELRLKNDAQYGAFEHALTKSCEETSNVKCFVRLRPDAGIETIDVQHSSGNTHVDELAIGLITRAAPFSSPPNELPIETGIHLDFDRLFGSVKTSAYTHLPPDMAHIGEQGRNF